MNNISNALNIWYPMAVKANVFDEQVQKYILNHNIGDDYNICNYDSYKIEDLVYKLYRKFNIELIKNEENNNYYDKNLNIPKLIIQESNNGLDKKSIDIRGHPTKLINLGWKIKYSIDDIINEFI
jgi:GDP-D-mannose dehydratase